MEEKNVSKTQKTRKTGSIGKQHLFRHHEFRLAYQRSAYGVCVVK